MIRKYSSYASSQGGRVFVLSKHNDYREAVYVDSKDSQGGIFFLSSKNLKKIIQCEQINYLCIFEPEPTYVLYAMLAKLFRPKLAITLFFVGSESLRLSLKK